LSSNHFVCIHGHFYQPPRVNPWLEVVEVQDSAAPFHDWNARVTAECYAPNAAARILCAEGTITKIINNYQYISFNFGPTLLCWLEDRAPEVYQALLEADAASLKRLGHGNAIAQVYNHLIMPLANERDKLTQVRWGITDFKHRFGRMPEGMWLAETAADVPTLECLAKEGIAFTILAPGQAARVKPPREEWQDVRGGRIDPRRAYKAVLPSGRTIALFFYDGPASRSIAFDKTLEDGHRLAQRLTGLLDPRSEEPQLAHVATDGESYGHHHRFGEMALAFALELLEQDKSIELINYGAFLAKHPPDWQVEIVEPGSWSCPHGVERWRADCGCALDPGRGWNQRWRTPLRNGLNKLNEKLARLFETQGGDLLNDPWTARDDYVSVLPPAARPEWDEFLTKHQRRPLDPADKIRAAKLLESQRWALYMFTSCAWFFDDIAGIEAVQNLRFAERALQLAADLDGGGWEGGLLEYLEQAQSNQSGEGSGADVWRRHVAPSMVGPRRVVAHAAIRGVMGDEPLPELLYCYRLETLHLQHRHNLGMSLAWGLVKVSHLRLAEAHQVTFAALHAGGHDFLAFVSPQGEESAVAGLGPDLERPLRLLEKTAIISILEKRVGGSRYTLGDLFLEGRRTLAQAMLGVTMDRYRETARAMYEANRDTMLFLRQISVPLPRVYTALAEAMLTEDLIVGLKENGSRPLPPELGELAMQSRSLGLSLTLPALRKALEEALTQDLEGLLQEPGDQSRVRHAGEVLDLATALAIELDLWRPQNLLYQLMGASEAKPFLSGLANLARRLKFEVGD
jgi:alpha-amylase/alpha-mannosidase (GH57 family)